MTAIPRTEASKGAIGKVRFTSTPDLVVDQDLDRYPPEARVWDVRYERAETARKRSWRCGQLCATKQRQLIHRHLPRTNVFLYHRARTTFARHN
jgi:hypothetical protein